MSDLNVSRFGADNGASDKDALFLKIWSGEVLTRFSEKNIMMGRHNVRTISNGKSAQFPRIGDISAEYHTPGTEIQTSEVDSGEVTVTIDDLLISHASIANIDEAKSHFDVRGPYTRKMGEALANQADRHVFQTALLSARTGPTITAETGNGGAAILTDTTGAPGSADYATNGEHIAEALYLAAQTLDEKDIPEEGRFAIFRPAQYYALVRAGDKIMNKDWGGRGSYAEGNIPMIAGIQILKSNHLPGTTVSNGTVAAGTGNKYAGDFQYTTGLVMTADAVATVKLMDVSSEMEWSARHQAWFMVSKYAMGHSPLRPECAIEIANTDSTTYNAL